MNEPDRRWSPGPATELDLREMAEKLGRKDESKSTACRTASHKNCRRGCACPCHEPKESA